MRTVNIQYKQSNSNCCRLCKQRVSAGLLLTEINTLKMINALQRVSSSCDFAIKSINNL